ncbi:MAG: acyl-CoA dehydrogenase [Gammaproteobacteria bacterium]|jgi:acyl-CoA dehydrogenase
MIDFTLPAEIEQVVDGLLRFIEQEIVPIEEANAGLLGSHRRLTDERGRYVPEVVELRKVVRMKSAEAGFYTIFGEEDFGGAGLGPLYAFHVYEAISHRYGPRRPLIHQMVIPSPFTNGLSPVLKHLKPEVLEQYLPGIASGEKSLCFGLSEPNAGSDVLAMRTKAVKDGDEWVINGSKQWITNSPYADYAMLFAITDTDKAAERRGGISGFFIPTDTPGFSVPGSIPLMGTLGAELGIVSLDDVRVPESHVIGELHHGLRVAIGGVNVGRVGLAASCVGTARWALELATEYANTRQTFGKLIGEHQMIQAHLAEAAMDIYAARNMALHCSWKLEQGIPARKEISMTKAFCTEMQVRVIDKCMAIHGAMGLTNELRLEEAFRFARIACVPDGTPEIQRRTIARELLKGDLSF